MKKFNNIPNKPYKAIEDGIIRYHSRSVALCGIVILSKGNGEYSLLAHTRGNGCPDEKGKWSFNCGYLDWNETLIDGVKRELWEEIGLDTDNLEFCSIVMDPKIDDSITGENKLKQNITIRFQVICDYKEINSLIENGTINNNSYDRGGELNEVDKIKIFDLSEPINKDEWAFNHGEIFNSYHEHYYGK